MRDRDPQRGERIADARRRRGWSQQDLAAKIGASRGAVINWEQGKWPRTHVSKVREVLQLDESWLPLDDSSRRDPRAMDNRELVAHMNLLVAELAMVSNEVNRRLTQVDLESSSSHRHARDAPGAIHFGQTDQPDYSELPAQRG